MSAIDGTWYDGKGSRGRAARLSQPAPGALRLEAGDEVREFAVAEVGLSPRLGRMPRTMVLPSGAGQLELPDVPELEQWLPAPSRVEALADWLERRRSAVLGSAVASVLGVVLFFQFVLPWMAAEVAPMVPAAMERTISDQALALLDRSQLRPSRLPGERREALQAKFSGLVAGLPREAGLRLDFRNAPGLGPNAFALPDGQIVMTDQLVALAGSDEELLAVLAHEAGHHEHRHGMRAALESSAVVVVAGFLFGDLSGTGALSVSLPVVLVESGFSRGHEREADEFAFSLLRRRGLSPEAFAKVMERLSAEHGDGDLGVIGYLSTHPASAERIAAARAAAGAPAAAE